MQTAMPLQLEAVMAMVAPSVTEAEMQAMPMAELQAAMLAAVPMAEL